MAATGGRAPEPRASRWGQAAMGRRLEQGWADNAEWWNRCTTAKLPKWQEGDAACRGWRGEGDAVGVRRGKEGNAAAGGRAKE